MAHMTYTYIPYTPFYNYPPSPLKTLQESTAPGPSMPTIFWKHADFAENESGNAASCAEYTTASLPKKAREPETFKVNPVLTNKP